MSDQRLRNAERARDWARVLVAHGRAGTGEGLVVSYMSWTAVKTMVLSAIYPLFDGSGWAILGTTEGGHVCGLRVDAPGIVGVA